MASKDPNRQGWMALIGKLQNNNTNTTDSKENVGSKETKLLRRGKLPPLENPPKVVVTKERLKSPKEEKIECYENSSCEISESEDKNVEATVSESLDSSNFPKVARTIQIASSWLKKSRTTPKEQRADSFLDRLEMFGPSFTVGNIAPPQDIATYKHWIVDPSGRLLFGWLVLVSIAVLYNLIFIIARQCFHELHASYMIAWFILDYMCDIIYAVDIFFQFRTGRYCIPYIKGILFIFWLIFAYYVDSRRFFNDLKQGFVYSKP